jgi:hypothetical protein
MPRPVTRRDEEIVSRSMQEFGELQSQRALFAGQWEETACILLPTARNTFFFGSFNWQGQKKTDRQVDMTGGLALHRFCAIADSLVTPRNMLWHGLEADGPDADYIMQDRSCRLWYEAATAVLFKLRYAQIANFAGQNYNIWQSLGAFGNATMFVDCFDSRMLPGSRGLRYRAVPLGETFYGQNHQGVVDRVHRWFRLTAYQAEQKFGRDWLPEGMQQALETRSQAVFDFLHVVRPRDEDDYDPQRLDARGKRFSSHYIAMGGINGGGGGNCLMAPEGGYRKFPYAVSRYDQTPGEVYGRGPAQIVLPSLKTLNAQKTTFLKQAHRAADPVLLAFDDGLVDFNLRPGALNKGGINADGKRMIDILPSGNIQIAAEMMAEERNLIDDTFLVSLFKVLNEHPNMTATQVIELVNEKGMLVAPTLGRQHSEYIPSMVERELDLAAELGLLPMPPPRLREARVPYRVTDNSPLAQAAKAGQAAGFLRSLDKSIELAQAMQDASSLDYYDLDVATPAIMRIQNAPETWIADNKKVQEKRQNRAKAVAQKQQLDSLPAKAAIMKAQAVQAKAGMLPPAGQQATSPQPMAPAA